MLVSSADSENHFLQKYRIMIHSYANSTMKNDYGFNGAKEYCLQGYSEKITSNTGRAKRIEEIMNDAIDVIGHDRD